MVCVDVFVGIYASVYVYMSACMVVCLPALIHVHMLVCTHPFSRGRPRSPLRLRSCVIHAWVLRGRPTYARVAVISALPVSSSLQGTWNATSSLWCVCACAWWRWWWWLQRCVRCKEWLQGAGSSVASTDRKPLLKCAACPELRPELARAPCGGV